jgi:hypothetical protein
VDAAVEEKIEEAGVDRDAVVFGAVAEVDGDFDGLSRGQHAGALLEGAGVVRRADRATMD